MITFLTVLTVLAFLAVIATLIMGALSMKGKDIKDRENSNLWMRRRITAQVAAIGLLMLTVYMKTQNGG